ncbi:regulation of nuclear pre-mRNA domain-containing protein 1B [Neocloeon triangulifer]|uniref:regulation of nuclear pre-mRNA domain-containing protein 1B n=1 Tax=Neocloeon triangulifer TaxID=2078957 RepID=UPI00286F7017|nr:regulation of nuclear pre-mRNA domain-containing protein 1B [Neocloeon triangulifer]
MTGFTENALVKKLTELNPSQQSIQTLSLWLIHHRKHHSVIVKVWMRELVKAKEQQKLTFMYLANDVIQNSKKKGPEFGDEYRSTLTRAFEHLGSAASTDDKTKQGLLKILKVWEDRGVYEHKLIKEWRNFIALSSKAVENGAGPAPKKAKTESKPMEVKEKERRHSETVVEVDGKTESHIILSPAHNPPGDPPEPEELVKALLDLERSASSDAAVREKIANLPPEVSRVDLLSKLRDKDEAQQLIQRVGEALSLLNDYNARLAAEMEDRKKLKSMLHDFLHAQKELLLQAEERHVEYIEKLAKVQQVKEELKSHLQNLPEMNAETTGSLAPLPSAGDLFRMN